MTDDEKIINAIENEMCMGRGLWELVSCGELVRMFRKHLATPAPAPPDPLHVANERGEGEPVAQWQIRMNDDASWENIDAEDVKFCRARGYQVRALYDHAAPKEKT